MPELWTPEKPLTELKNDLLGACLKQEDRIFASTETANNHLDAGYDEVPELLRPKIVTSLGDLVVAHGIVADFIAPVPDGANGWGYALADKLEPKPKVLTFTKLARRLFANTSETDEVLETLDTTAKVLVIDDVTNDGGTSEAMAQYLSNQGLDVVLVLSILFRGDLYKLKCSRFNRAVLLPCEIPLMIDWKARNSSGVIKPLAT